MDVTGARATLNTNGRLRDSFVTPSTASGEPRPTPLARLRRAALSPLPSLSPRRVGADGEIPLGARPAIASLSGMSVRCLVWTSAGGTLSGV